MEWALFLLSILLCITAYLKFKVNYIKKDISEKVEIIVKIRTDIIVLILLWVAIILLTGICAFIDMCSVIGGMLCLLLATFFTYWITIKTAFTSNGITTIYINKNQINEVKSII